MDQISSEELLLPVSEYWEVGVGWRWQSLANLRPNTTLMNLASIRNLEDDADRVAWSAIATGSFSVSQPSARNASGLK